MKKLFYTLAIIHFTLSIAFSQSPQAFKYQAIARDASGNPLASTLIGVRPNVHDATAVGPVIYQETFSVTTNSFGLFSIEIGNGTPIIGTFNSINWGSGNKYIEVEIDFGIGYISMGTSQLLSVPYALYSANGTPGPIGATGPTGATGATGSGGSQGYSCWDTNQNGINDPAEDVNTDGFWNVNDCNAGVAVPGPAGPTGSAGANGTNGTNGATGPTGAAGTNGTNGATGATGSAGTNGINGATGPTGATGLLTAGSAAGNTPYWDGTNWITTSGNIFNNGGNVGIGTTTPSAKLQITNGSVLFDGATGATPVSGAGTRMMWVSASGAFRSGYVSGTNWDNANIGTNSFATGNDTKASGAYSFASGQTSTASGNYSTAMGYNTSASGNISTAMGNSTSASGNTATAIGLNDVASGDNSTALGCYASTNGQSGSFVIGDNFPNVVQAATVNEMTMRFINGFRLFTSPGLTTGVTLAGGGGAWASVSDKKKKENFKPLDPEDVLKKVKLIPVTEWNYKTQDKTVHHVGPMAQDFYKAFKLAGIGNDTTITTTDIDGINMLAIQALEKRTAELKIKTDEIEILKTDVAELKIIIGALKNQMGAEANTDKRK